MSERAQASGTVFWEEADETEALQRYRTLVNTIGDGIYQLDAEGRFVAVNDVIVKTTGYAREELLGKHVSLLLAEDDISAIEREIKRRIRNSGDRTESFEFAVRTAEGDLMPCELRLNLLVEDDSFRGTVGVVRNVTERKRAKRTLTERERQLERESDLTDRILETSPVGIMVLDSDGEVTRFNERTAEILGVPERERETYDPSDRPTYDEDGTHISTNEHPFSRAIKTGEPVYDRVLQVERPDGTRRWLSVNAAPILDDDGEVEHVVTTGEDITAIKERERELENELSEIFGRVTDAFYALDEQWRISYANERAEELIDYKGKGLVGEDLREVFEWAVDSKLGEEYRTAMETQEPTSFEFYYPEPLEAWYEVHAYPSDTGLSVYFRDVTERKRRERALEESEHRYRTLVENFPNGAVALVDRNLRYRTVGGNPIISDVTIDDLEARPVREVLPANLANELVPRYEAAIDGESGSFEAESNDRTFQFQIVPVRDETGDVFAALGMSQDITERTEYERQLEASNERLESFASMLAHELRNPVTIGQIYSQQLPAETDSEAVEYVREAFDRIENMIDIMLVLTRGREAVGESNPLSLAEVARDAWGEVDAIDATLDVEIDGVIRADETYVRNLFRNLFENAVQHGAADVTVRVGELPTGFYVGDDGTGIPAEERGAVFDAGFTTAASNGGTGLGLAFVEELAEVYGWTCEVTESARGGARFEFRNVDFVSAG